MAYTRYIMLLLFLRLLKTQCVPNFSLRFLVFWFMYISNSNSDPPPPLLCVFYSFYRTQSARFLQSVQNSQLTMMQWSNSSKAARLVHISSSPYFSSYFLFFKPLRVSFFLVLNFFHILHLEYLSTFYYLYICMDHLKFQYPTYMCIRKF